MSINIFGNNIIHKNPQIPYQFDEVSTEIGNAPSINKFCFDLTKVGHKLTLSSDIQAWGSYVTIVTTYNISFPDF